MKSEFLNILQDRGFIHQCTDMAALDEQLTSSIVTAYIGFDATADSLHVGSLVQIMMLRCGGGRKNKFMMHCLQQLLPDLIIQDVDDLYWDGDLLEAQGFAYMAVRKLRELPISFPTTTGVKEPTTGGELIYPENFAGSQAASALQTN